jgi:prephenate dehydrogenase
VTGAAGPGHVANIVGLGLIGGSIGLSLRARGWEVAGVDLDPGRVTQALAIGAISS